MFFHSNNFFSYNVCQELMKQDIQNSIKLVNVNVD